MDAGPLTEAEQRELDKWLESAPGRRGALIRARTVWTDLDRVGALARGQATKPASKFKHLRFWHERTWRAGATALAAAAGLAALGWIALPALLHLNHSLESDVGEVRRVTLADGSTVVLNSGSRLRVNFRPEVREVQLEKGEALFEVAKNKERPFIVSTPMASVRAVGTAFAVRIADDAVNVTVTEGVVEVGGSAEPPQRVAVNERATVRREKPIRIEEITPVVAHRELAWQEGMVSFAGESLERAAAEVNRYSRRQVVIDDPALATKPVVGIFRAGDVDGFASAAAVALGAQIHQEGDTVRLTPAAHP
jgi:transmembrane sensor